MRPTTVQDIFRAQKRISPYLLKTPIEESPELGANVYLKLENLNRTHSFKIRGALNAMLALSDEERALGIVACSAGNHAQGVAYAAQLCRIPAKVVMPAHTPKRKISGARKYGAEIILHGDTYDDAEIHARKMENQIGMTFISPYNNTQVIAGQGTIGLEIFDTMPDLGRIVIPTSGGGMLAGVGMICKTLNPNCEVIGVQSIATAAMHNFLVGTSHPQQETIADGLSGEIETGSITLDLCKKYTDQMVLVSEEEIADAIRWMLFKHNWVIEGAAAVGIAAMLKGAIPIDDKPTVIIISGGNIDFDVLKGTLGLKLILFDIDGTLLHSDGVGSAATKRAMQEVFGTLGTLANFRFGGKTDWQMLLETLEGLVHPNEIEGRLAHYDDVLARHISDLMPKFNVRPCIGADDLLHRTISSPDVTAGILTANMPKTAFLKLKAAGYDPSVFQVTVFGSDAPTREALAPIALRRAHHVTRYDFPPEQVIIIGDTPEDITCARSIGARIISVATGRFSLPELAVHRPDTLVENLADTDFIWSLL